MKVKLVERNFYNFVTLFMAFIFTITALNDIKIILTFSFLANAFDGLIIFRI